MSDVRRPTTAAAGSTAHGTGHGGRPSSSRHRLARGRPGSAPSGSTFASTPSSSRMQVLDSGGGWFAGGAERPGRPLSGRTRRSPRTEDTRSLQVRRRGREPSPMTTGTAGVPAVAATDYHRATRAPLPFIKVGQQPSGLRNVNGSKPRHTSRTAACTGDADDGGGPDTDTFLASLETSLAASREVFASVPANTRLGAAMGAAAAAAATTAAGPSPKTTGKALSQGRKGGTTGEGSGGGGERGGDHYQQEQQQQQQRPRADDEATANRLQRRLRLDQQPEPQLEPEKELEQRPRSTPEPEPEPEPAIDDLERRMQAIQQDQDRRRREDECAQSTPLEPAADFDGIGMEELEQRLLSLQRTQDRRRDELDSYMTSLRSREVASDDGTTESLVEFPEGFMEIVESMKREEMERPWLSYLGEENAPKEGETDEQRRNRRGVELIARLDKILAEKTKEAKRAAAFRKLQQRLQAEEHGEEVAAVQGNRAAVSKRLDETMSDTVGKLVRRNLGALSASRFITLSDEREARVAQLLEEDGNGRSYHVDTGYDKERIDEIDDRLRAFHPDTEPVALGIVGSVEAGREVAEAEADGDGEANLAPSDGATSISARSLTPHAARPTSDVDAGGRAASDHTQRSMARQEATDFIRGAAVERRQRARETEIDQLLRRMRTEAFAPMVAWADDPSQLDSMLADARQEIGDGEVRRLTDDECKELCKIQQQFS